MTAGFAEEVIVWVGTFAAGGGGGGGGAAKGAVGGGVCGGDSADFGHLVGIGAGASDGWVGRAASWAVCLGIVGWFLCCVAWRGLGAAKAE